MESDKIKLPDTGGVYESYGDEGGVSFGDIIRVLWRYRGRIFLLTFFMTLLIVFIGGAFYLFQERTWLSRVEFKLNFEGIDRSEYPSGLAFNPSDIIAPAVIEEVYRENKLEGVMPYAVFKGGLAVYQRNDKLRLLEYAYGAKMSEPKLRLEERERLEQEFIEKKKALLVPIYSLVFSEKGKLPVLTDSQRIAFLTDILRVWADHADRVKGANRYQISLVSRSVLSREDLDREDFLVGTDMLRLTIKRVVEDIGKVSELPGASVMKTAGSNVTMKDLQCRMDDCERFTLSPLVGMIRQSGATRQRDLTIAYLENRIFELKLQQDLLKKYGSLYETSLSQYMQRKYEMVGQLKPGEVFPGLEGRGTGGNVPAMIPQLGASFLDSLISMAQENSDAKFRQEITGKMIENGLKNAEIQNELQYYEEIYRMVKDSGREGFALSSESLKVVLNSISQNHERAYKEITQTIDDLNEIYTQLSRSNLNPGSILYTLTGPAVLSTERAIPARKILLYMILFWVLGEGLILVYALFLARAKVARLPRQKPLSEPA